MTTNQESQEMDVFDLETISAAEPNTPSSQITREAEEEPPLSVASDSSAKPDSSDEESRPGSSRAEYEDDEAWGIVPQPYPNASYPAPYHAVMDGVEWWPVMARPELIWRPLEEQVAMGPMWWFAPRAVAPGGVRVVMCAKNNKKQKYDSGVTMNLVGWSIT